MEKTPLKLFKKKHLIEGNASHQIPASPLMKKMGFGTGVAVYLLPKSTKNSSSPWAIKKVLKGLNTKNKDSKIYAKRLAVEAEILRSLTHPNIIGFRAFEESLDGRYNLCMEAMTTSLGDLLEKRHDAKLGPLEIRKIHQLGFNISKALKYLHKEAMLLHGDIKSFNILIKGDFVICKLCDFGVSIPIKKDGLIDFDKNPAANYTGTDLWSAPEVFEEDETLISTKSEIFSFGLVLYETITLCPPHTLEMEAVKKSLDFDDEKLKEEDDEDDEYETDYMVGTRPLFPNEILTTLSGDYDNILQIFHICTDDFPEKRPSASKLTRIFEELNVIVID